MEQKKILMVAISVGVFLVIVIGAAILVFGSNNPSPVMASARGLPPGTSGAYLVPQPLYSGQTSQPNPGNESQSGNDSRTQVPEISSASAGNPVGTPAVNIDTNVKPTPQLPQGNSSSDSSTIISVNRPSTAAVPDTPPASRSASAAQSQARPATAAQVQTTTTQVQPTATPARTTQTQAAPAQAAQTQTAPAQIQTSQTRNQASQVSAAVPTQSAAASRPASTRARSDFWVQTGSFTAMSRALGAKDVLAAKGISSIIENRDVDGTTFFRVRVGPYTSLNEADYWLSLIKSIAGFENSQVFQGSSIN